MRGRVASPLFVGRREELSILAGALARARDGEGSLTLIGGEAGVGKSRLIGELVVRAERAEMAVAIGECLPLGDAELPFAPVLEALRSLEPGSSTLSLTDDAGAGPGPGLAINPGGWQAPAFERLLERLTAAARARPLLLVLEDFQWADNSTRDFVSFLVRATRREPLAIVVSYRSDELGIRHPSLPFVLELERTGRASRIDLAAFTRSELREQVAAILEQPPPADLVDGLHQRSDGNPFFTEELLATRTSGAPASSDASLPASLRDTLLARVHAQPPIARRVLRVAAVAGRSVEHPLLAAVVELDGDELNDALRETVEGRLLTHDPGAAGYSFRHALLREAVYADLLPGERQSLHLAYAQALRDHGGATGVPAEPGELAHHWYSAGEPAEALEASLAAAAAAEQLHASREAWFHYRRALEIWEVAPTPERDRALGRVEVSRRAAEAGLRSGEAESAIEFGRDVLADAEERRDQVAEALARERLGRYLWTVGREQDAMPEYSRAVEVLPADAPLAERAEVLAGEAQALMLLGHTQQSNARCEEALAVARAAGADSIEANVLSTVCSNLCAVGDFDGGVRAAREAATIARRSGLVEQLMRSYVNGSDALDRGGRVDESIAMASEGVELAHEFGSDGNWGNFLRAEIAARLIEKAEWDRAQRLLEDAIDAAPAGTAAAIGYVHLAELLALRGDFDRSRQAVLDGANQVPESRASQWQAPVAIAQATLEMWAGDPEAAARVVSAALAREGETELLSYTAKLYELGTRACADISSAALRDEATVVREDAVARALLERFDRTASRLIGGIAPAVAACRATAVAERSRIAGFGDEALWEVAQQRWDESRSRFDGAYARWRRADAILAAGGDRRQAQALVREAHEVAVALDARPLREGIERLAVRGRLELAAEEPPAEPSNPLLERLELTPRELQVLALLAAGMTNREIASELFISEKTASVHVSRILAKLSVPNRTAAAAAAHELGVTRA
ncbi:MAG TPA: AAA family ATPase [Solirubrobacteraceae bacterium]